MTRLAFVLFILLAGCAERALEIPLDGGVDLADAMMPSSDGATAAPFRFVYAHSDTELYSIDPTSLAIVDIGPFVWPGGPDQMTDIALDQHGRMLGVSETAVYAVDPATASCTFLSSLGIDPLNALTFVAGSNVGDSEKLIGASSDGSVYQIDPATGAQTFLGEYGNGWYSSGDLVSIAGATYATVIGDTTDDDTLVKVDVETGAATEIGVTGVSMIWGLGYWKQQLFGFTVTDGIVLIDIDTGNTTPIPGTDTISFWGAGVITAAPTD